MSALPAPDDTLVSRFRAAVARALAERTKAAERAGGKPFDLDDQQAFARRLLNDELERYASERMAAGTALLSEEDEEAVGRAVFDRLFALGRLQALIDDERFTDITANGHDEVWLTYTDGRKEPGPALADSKEEFIELLREVGRRCGLSEREFNPARPSLNVTLPDGSRLFVVAWVCDRPCLSIRRHRLLKVSMADLRRLGALDRGLEEFLRAAVRARKQILVAGATGAGKTTMLRALAAEIPPEERIVTIETELELGLDRFPELHSDCVALEAREANGEGVGAVSAAELVRMSLRMNPDRVLLGEVRGAEVVPLLNAMSQGNEGSMCTVHADSSATVFNKLALYAVQAPERLPIEATNLLAASAVDLVVWIAKTKHGRFIGSVRQVVQADGAVVVTNELFRPGVDGRAVPGDPIPVDLLADLQDEGYDPALHLRPGGWWE
jgi:Flp pilus assembly CpaF family ATPase